jgi:transcriptional regulator with XRE-family HTH domain
MANGSNPRQTTDAPGGLAVLLRGLRERALLTQEQLAARAGVSVSTIRGVETGRILRPHIGSLRLLAEALGLTDREQEALAAAARGEQARPAQLGSGPPCQLPADVAGFTGRAHHLRQLDALLVDPGLDGGRATAAVIAVIGGPPGSARPPWPCTGAIRCVTGSLTGSSTSTCEGMRLARRCDRCRR